MINILKKHSNKVLWLAIFIYILLFCFMSLKKYYAFEYNLFDLAIFNQVFFNTSEGRWFEMTINLNNYLADHFTPIIILLLPIYKLWPRPENLLILQSIVLGLSAWPLYKIAKYVSKDNLLALVVAIMWLVNPFVHNANIFEFHLLPIAVFFIFWTFYFYQKSNYKIFLLFFILALLVREDTPLILVAFSPIAFLDKRSIKWIITPIFSLVYFLLALKIISIFDQGGYKFLIYYSWLGGDTLLSIIFSWLSHPLQFLTHLFSFQNLSHLFTIFLVVALLPLLSPKYLYLAFLPIMQFALTSTKITFTIYEMHYALLFLTGFFIAIIFSLNKINKEKKFLFSKYIYKEKKFFLFFIVVTIFYFSFAFSPVKYILFGQYDKGLVDLKKDFVLQIPKESSLMVDAGLATNLSSRSTIYPLQYSYFARSQFFKNTFDLPNVDYILIDMDDMFDVLVRVEKVKKIFESKSINIASDFRERLDDYTLIKIKNNLLLWQNKQLSESQKNLPLYSLEEKSLSFSNKIFLVSSDYSEEVDYNILKITYQKIHQEDKNYLLRFYSNDVFFDLPLDYGLWPEKDWPENNLMSFYYYLDQDIDSYQVFSWKGINQFGFSREAIVNKTIIAETRIITIENNF